MTDKFGVFPTELEAEIRRHVVRHCDVEDATSPTSWVLFGVQVTFYRDGWFGYMQRPRAGEAGSNTPLYFVVQTRRGRKIQHFIPVANAPGAIGRVNRTMKVSITRDNFLQYLRFYYMFTPATDRAYPLSLGPLQYAVPTAFAHIALDPGAPHTIANRGSTKNIECSRECIVRGAIWRYLDENDQRFIPLKFKPARVRPFRASGRIVMQVQDALFAVDVKVPASSGVPLLTSPELLYQGGLVEPVVLSDRALPMSERINLEKIWRDFRKWAEKTAGSVLRGARRLVSWAVTAVLVYLWAISALFPIIEMSGSPHLRRHLDWLGSFVGFQDWPMALLQLTILAVITFLSIVFYLANMDVIFNWIFKLLPRRMERWLARHLNPHIDRRDRDLIALDTFRKRAGMAARLLIIWTGYAVLAFASLQIALNSIFEEQHGSALQIVWSLCKQAALNVPIVVYAIIRFPWIFGDIRPVEQNVLNPYLLMAFHGVIAVVIMKGIYRIWVFTKEATPRSFYRRLRYHR